MDFMSDSLYNGRRFRLLTLVDTATRECPAIEVDQSLTGQRVVAVLERLKQSRGLPQRIAVDNCPEFVSKALDAWAHAHGVQLEFIWPGTPTDNPYIEAFNGRVRDECLSQHWFVSLEDARHTIETWRLDYNHDRPHGALGNCTPAAVAAGWPRVPDGQLGKELTQPMERIGNRLTHVKRNMANRLLLLDEKVILRRRALVETVFDQLKHLMQIAHSRHRSPTNFAVNLLAGLVAYCRQPAKPALYRNGHPQLTTIIPN